MSGTTALVSEGKFSFTNGVLFAEASDRHQHRRASQEELRAHFESGSDKGYAAHWFEAQLLHYGLQPSKVKSVARMRLFDAFRGGALSVPSHIIDIEKRLKKEWMKQDRENKKPLKATELAVVPQEATSQTSTRKRKAEVTVNITVNANHPGDTAPIAANAAKRIKESPPSGNSSVTVPQYAARPTARRGRSSHAPRPQQHAIRASPAPISHSRQTARGSPLFAAREHMQSPQPQSVACGDYTDSFDEPPPPYKEYCAEPAYSDEPAHLAPLGLLNGRYDISCPFVESEWPLYGSELSLVLTLAGSSLWGRFDLGIIDGVLYFEERPRRSSFGELTFHWRGREAEGPILYNDEINEGWIKFLGDGRIEGCFDYQGICFQGQRLPGQGTRSEIDVGTLQNQWDQYTEDEYERLNQARWR